MAKQPLLDLARLVGGVVVLHQVQVPVFGPRLSSYLLITSENVGQPPSRHIF
jgi:hypothetical protein